MSTAKQLSTSDGLHFKVLLIDDASAVRLHLKKILDSFQPTILEAGDGQQGLDICKNHLDIALIICDVNMPVMDGMTFLEHFNKQWPADKKKPKIIMLTSEHKRDSVLEAKKFGVSGWVIKPPPVQTFVNLISKLMKSDSSK